MEPAGVLVGNVNGINAVIRRVNADDILDNRVTAVKRRNRVVERTLLSVRCVLKYKGTTFAERDIAFTIEPFINREVESGDDVCGVIPDSPLLVVASLVVRYIIPYIW